MPKICIRTVAVLIFGPPGSGKGTVSKHLIECFDFPHISTGDMLRDEVKTGSELGLAAEVVMHSGALLPDDVVNRIVEQRIGRSDCDAGFILDGCPRTL